MEERNCPHCGALFIDEYSRNNFTEWVCKECGFPKKISLLDDCIEEDSTHIIIDKIVFDFSSNMNSKNNNKTFDECNPLLEKKIQRLFPVEKLVISALFGLDDGVPKTIEEMATMLNTDIRTVKQIKKNALKRMRNS